MALAFKLPAPISTTLSSLLHGLISVFTPVARSGSRGEKITLSCVLFMVLMSTSHAHEITPAVVNILVNEDKTINVSILANLESMIAEIGPNHEDTNESINSQKYTKLRAMSPAQLTTEFEKFKPTFLQTVSIENGANQPLDLKQLNLHIPEVGNTSVRRDTSIELIYSTMLTDENMYWQWDDQYGEIILRADSYSGELDYAALLAPGQRSLAIPVVGRDVERSLAQVVLNYIVVGFTHILPKGLDHVLFIVALFLISPFWKSLLVQATTFTIAHSITLFLGATKLVTVPGSVVEPLIALSIVALCIENIFSQTLGKTRVLLVFIFGLLHGLGFAGVLGEVGLETDSFLIALLSFNVGVELGQLLVILICMLAVGIWFRHKPWYHSRVTIPASLIIGAIGMFWFIERVV